MKETKPPSPTNPKPARPPASPPLSASTGAQGKGQESSSVKPAARKPSQPPKGVPIATYTNRGKAARRPVEPPEGEPARSLFTWQLQLLAVLALIVLTALAVIFFSKPDAQVERTTQRNALDTALASTGFTPPPSRPPGSDFGIDLVIFGIKDYVPGLPKEQITFQIHNTRDKSLFVGQCDGIVLQRFLGTDIKNKDQEFDFNNWESIAPGGYPFCGPAGSNALQIGPGIKADASFKFDGKATRPYAGKSWDVSGTYRLLVQYFLYCPSNSLVVADCTDKRLDFSVAFKIIDVQTFITSAARTATAQGTPPVVVATPAPTPPRP